MSIAEMVLREKGRAVPVSSFIGTKKILASIKIIRSTDLQEMSRMVKKFVAVLIMLSQVCLHLL